MNNLIEFAEIVKISNLEKKRKTIEDQTRKSNEIGPLLSELFNSITKEKRELKTEPIREVSKSASEPKVVENKPTEINKFKKSNNSDTKINSVIGQIQKDFQLLKKYVENKSSSSVYPSSAGSGEVRILRMDDMEKGVTPSNGDTLVWSSALNKFELKQQVVSGGTMSSMSSMSSIIPDEEMPYAKRVDFVNDNELYKGEAVVGSLVNTSVWRIRKIVISIDGDVSETWADGNSNYDNSWADRLTYTYS